MLVTHEPHCPKPRAEARGESAACLCRNAPVIEQVEMTESDIEFAEKIARRLGFSQTAYTSSSALWGLFCLPDHSRHRHGCIIKTKQFGFMFVADLEDLQLHDLHEQENARGQTSQTHAGQACQESKPAG